MHVYLYMHASHVVVSSAHQLDAYDLLSKEPSTVIMAENQCKELLGTYMYVGIPYMALTFLQD